MTESRKRGSVVPLVPPKCAVDLVERIESLKADADARGFGTLAYFLDMALSEAQVQANRIAKGLHDPGPWRPLSDQE